MAGRPSNTTLAELTSRIEALEGSLSQEGSKPTTWSGELEQRVAALEKQVERISGFLKSMHTL